MILRGGGETNGERMNVVMKRRMLKVASVKENGQEEEEDMGENGECKRKRRGRWGGRKWRDEEGDGDCGKKRERKQFTGPEKEEWLEQKRLRRQEKKGNEMW